MLDCNKIKIIFAGTPEPAALCLEFLVTSGHYEVAAVITQPDAHRGRGRVLRSSPVARIAEKYGITTYKWDTIRPDTQQGQEAHKIISGLADHGAVAAVVVAYGNLIPQELLTALPLGWVNLHYSLLPRWRGASPVQAAIAAGDSTTGATTFVLDHGMDTGPVISQCTTRITVDDTAETLLSRLTVDGQTLVNESLFFLLNGGTPTPQNHCQATYAGKISVHDAKIIWSHPGDMIQRTTRAHTPWPGAWTELRGHRYKIGLLLPYDGHVSHEIPPLSPGQLFLHDERVLVGTGCGVLAIDRIQPPGKKMMDAVAWARGQQRFFSDPTSVFFDS